VLKERHPPYPQQPQPQPQQGPENRYQTPGAVAGNPAVYRPPSEYPGYQGGCPGDYPDVQTGGSWYPVGFVAYRHFRGADSAACAVEGARDVTMNKEVDGGPWLRLPT